MRVRSLSAVAAVAAVALLAGCGGDDVPDVTPDGDPDAGRVVFLETAQPGCGDCHALADAGTTGTMLDLDARDPTFDEVERAVRAGPGAMPSYDDQLTDEQIADVAAYVSQAAGG
jgi:cytochrome c6